MSGSFPPDGPKPRPRGERSSINAPPKAETPPPPGAATCLLRIGESVVLRATVPPDAEYALFDASDIELRSSEPGRVREHGYATTGESALERLASSGITAELARECAEPMLPVLAEAYARGQAVRRIARHLGPAELLQADTWDGQSYKGVFLDVATLARDLQTPRAAATLQALYLAVLLENERGDVPVYLATDAWTKLLKPGERTHKRPSFGAAPTIVSSLGALAREGARPEITEQLARQDVIAFLRSRADTATNDDTRALYQSLEKKIAVRDIPDRGPLADPDLWAIETRLDAGQLDDVMDLISAAERTRGRTPGTTYLRARASLALRAEPPKLIAERISALALSMTSFQELSLLAAEAWLECGDSRRAMPFARDLVDAPGVEEGLLLRAQRLLARAVGAAPDASRGPSVPPAPSRAPSMRHVSQAPPPPPAQSRSPSGAAKPQYISNVPPHEPRQSSMPSPPEMALRPSVVPRAPRTPVIDLDVPPPPPEPGGASFTLDLPPTPRPSSVAPPARASRPPETRPPSGAPRRRISGAIVETRPPRSYDPRAEPEDDDADLEAPTLQRRGSVRHEPSSRTSGPPPEGRYTAGASLPPYSVERPTPILTRAPLLPRSTNEDELAEHLTLPPGVVGEPKPEGDLPQSILEARVQFTLMSRELGLDYRLQRGIALRTDATSIEHMQQVLLESYADGVTTREGARDLERHGAFLSEILARVLDAQWFDISPSELGHWAMIVPPDTRIWPFGRIARLVAMGTRERDLVSYFFELKSRMRR